MKLHLSRADGSNQITSCGADFVSVNGVRHERSLLITPEHVSPQWPVPDLQSLTAARVADLLDFKPEVALLGTGPQLRFPPAAVLRPLIEARIGYEIMDTGAACRTYTILVAEGRRVLAALIVA